MMENFRSLENNTSDEEDGIISKIRITKVASGYLDDISSDEDETLKAPGSNLGDIPKKMSAPLPIVEVEENAAAGVPSAREGQKQRPSSHSQSASWSEAARPSHLNPELLDEHITHINETLSLSEEDEDPEWPLLTKNNQTVADTGWNGCLTVEEDNIKIWDAERWWNHCHDRDIESRYLAMWESEDFHKDDYRDVTFAIGPQEKEVKGHKLILSAVCENEDFRKVLNTSEENLVIRFSKLQPAAFKNVLKYVYTQKIELEDPFDALEVLEVAKSIGISELYIKCNEFLKSNIDCKHALKIFLWAIECKDDQLRQNTGLFITRHIYDILSSDEFVQLSKENLYDFLHSDDWYIDDELQVFTAVIRWAKHKINPTGLRQDNKPSGSDLRKTIGRALYQIRFSSLENSNKFLLKVVNPYKELFTLDESIALSTYIAGKSPENIPDEGDPVPAAPPMFNNLIRVKMEQSVTEEDGSENGGDDENTFEAVLTIRGEESIVNVENANLLNNGMEFIAVPRTDSLTKENETALLSPLPKKRRADNATTTVVQSNIISDTSSIAKENEMLYSQSPNKRQRCDNTDNVTTTDSTPSPSPITSEQPSPIHYSQSIETAKNVSSLLDYVKFLSYDEESANIERIQEVLKISTIPQTRIYLPNLREFNLTLISKNYKGKFECGAALKSYIKTKSAYLSEILFFDKSRKLKCEQGSCESEKNVTKNANVLLELLTLKVNVNICFAGIVFLKINHKEGIILMNLIKDAQKILNGARNFHLKVLAVSECELYSLDPVNKDALEDIVMRKVKGLKNHADFLRSCRNLRNISWNDLGTENLDLTEDLFNKNPHLKKLALAKCNLRTGNPDEHGNLLQELYLDNCDFDMDVILALPKLVYVRRVQIYTTKCNPALLLPVLQMESLEWLFIWELAFTKEKVGKKSVLTEKSQKAQQFLSTIFGAEFCKRDCLTFMLEKKKEVEQISPGTSSSALQEKPRDPLDPACWKGTKFTKAESFVAITELDFTHFSYDKFFSNYKEFEFFETKKKKPVATGSGNSNNGNKKDIPLHMDTAEPVSNSSTDEAVDAVES